MSDIEILVVEDESIIAMDLEQSLKSLDYAVLATVASGEAAIAQLTESQPDIIIMDIKLKGKIDGIEAGKKINKLYNIPIVYMSANADLTKDEHLGINKPGSFISKPVMFEELKETLKIALSQSRENSNSK